MADELPARADALLAGVIAPLILGGPMTLQRPFGARLALRIGSRSIIDDDLRSRIDVARVRRARRYAAVDTLPPLDGAEWALAAALNDLLQVTNHELSGPFSRGRHAELLASVRATCEAVPAPHDVRSALARHTTFGTALAATRTDTLVQWWTGKANFRGQRPSGRLTAWPGLRRVHVDERPVRLTEMCDGGFVTPDAFLEVLGLWLGRSPLTDVATLTRDAPVFGWSASTLSLIATVPGYRLAWRALCRQPGDRVVRALAQAAKEIPDAQPAARAMADEVAKEAAEAFARAS